MPGAESVSLDKEVKTLCTSYQSVLADIPAEGITPAAFGALDRTWRAHCSGAFHGFDRKLLMLTEAANATGPIRMLNAITRCGQACAAVDLERILLGWPAERLPAMI